MCNAVAFCCTHVFTFATYLLSLLQPLSDATARELIGTARPSYEAACRVNERSGE
jgi:hypothetical protein